MASRKRRLPGADAPRSESDNEADLEIAYPGEDNPPPDGYDPPNPAEIRAHNRTAVSRVQKADNATTLAILLEIARRHYPTELAIMTGPKAPLMQPARRDPVAPDKLCQPLFAEMLRLQGSPDISVAGKF